MGVSPADEMGLPVLFVGGVSIVTVWMITNLGLPPGLWTFGVIPVLSVYCLCDERKLRKAAAQFRASRIRLLTAAIVLSFFCILHAQFSCVHFILWKLGVLLVWLLCMSKGFNFEKTMFVTDTCGAWAKVLLWSVVKAITSEAMWMSYKGVYAFCCTYSRKRVVLETNHYYNLQNMHEELVASPEDYDFSFEMGACSLQCEYRACTLQCEYIPSQRSGDAGGDYSSERAAVSGPLVSHMSLTCFPPQVRDRCDTRSSSRSPAQEVEWPSSKVERGQDKYTLVPSRFNKVEASLKYKSEMLESYTFYNIAWDAVAEFKRVLQVLQTEGNLIFSNLNREIGSSRPRAHARCYEFGELIELILNQSYKLHKVDLRESYMCTISGRWTLLQQMLLAAVFLGINYYQLTGPPKDLSTTILLLAFYGFIQISFDLMIHACSQPWLALRRIVYDVLKNVSPTKMKVCYQHFQVHIPQLTFCNESYCYPHFLRFPTHLCLLASREGAVPRFASIHTLPPRWIELLQPLREGSREFDLINLKLFLKVTFYKCNDVHLRNIVQVEVAMFRIYDLFWYRDFFEDVDMERASNLMALMSWQEDNQCPGVLKTWPERNLIKAYRYEELFSKVLLEGFRPMATELCFPMDIIVE